MGAAEASWLLAPQQLARHIDGRDYHLTGCHRLGLVDIPGRLFPTIGFKERDIDRLPVGDGCPRGVTIEGMLDLRRRLQHAALPANMPIAGVDAYQPPRLVFFHEGGDKDAILPDDRRGMSRPRQGYLPNNPLLHGPIPLRRQFGLQRSTIPARPAPARPVFSDGRRSDQQDWPEQAIQP